MVSFVLHITSQVEHTKKHSSIDSESKSVKRNADHQNRSTVYFYIHVTLVLPYGEKTYCQAWTCRALWCQVLADQVCVIVQSIGGLQQLFCQCFTHKCCQKHEFYHRKGYWKSNAIRITTIMSSMLWRPLYTLFSYCFTLYRLGVMFRCCNNLSYIFIHTYFHYQASNAK